MWIGTSLPRYFESSRARNYFVVVSCLIALGVWMPVSTKNLILDGVLSGYADLVASPYEKYSLPYFQLKFEIQRFVSLPKVGHFVLFLLLSMIVRLGRPRDRLTANLYFLMLFAMTTETLQFFTFGRVPQIMDLLIDVGGIVCGLAFSELVRVRKKYRESSISKP